MKKLIIASAIAMTMTAGSAMASQGEVQFFGSVTSQTCDLAPEVGGSVNKLIQLGTVSVGGEGKAVSFTLKAKDPANCTEADKLGAHISWVGNLGTNGIENQTGTATGAHVVLQATNAAQGQDKPVTNANSTITFDQGKLADGYQFTAKLKGGTEAGDYKSAVAYAVAYK